MLVRTGRPVARAVASQQGLTPSEGNPQFHQQFVYAVAMKTIRHFERALGRKIIWYPRLTRTRSAGGRVQIQRDYVQQLRIYPHALRDANAYYDPDKTALLFGYFDAAEQSDGRELSRWAGLHLPQSGHRRARDDARDSGLDSPSLHRRHESRRGGVPRGLRRHRGAAPALHVPAPSSRTASMPPAGGWISRRSCSASWRRSSAKRCAATAAPCAT